MSGPWWSLILMVPLLLALLLGGATAAVLSGPLPPVTEQALLATRNDVRKHGRADPLRVHQVMLVTRQRNLPQLHTLLEDISDPSSSNYGHYLSRSAVAGMTVEEGLPDKIVQTLHALALEAGLDDDLSVHIESFGDYVIARAPVRTWERLLQTKFYVFNHKDLYGAPAKPFVRALQYTMPAALAPFVESIQNTVQLPPRIMPKWTSPGREVSRRSRSPDLQCNKHKFDNLNPQKPILRQMPGFVTPARLNAYYKIDSNNGSHLASQSMYESDNQNYSPADLLQFQNVFGVFNRTMVRDVGHHNVSKVCGEPTGQCGEANLDIQYMMAVSQRTPTWFIAQNGNSSYDGDFWMVIFLRTLMNMTAPPLVNSVSYGAQEPEQSLSSIHAFEAAALKLAVMGVTVVISAGDDGVHSSSARAGGGGSNNCGYSASYPATSLYVISVGAVQGPESRLAPNSSYLPATVCSSAAGGIITGGGGFSSYIQMPEWQRATVDGYFAKLAPWQRPAPGYNYPGGNSGPTGVGPTGKPLNITSGRAYPDVALLGYNYIVYQNKSAEGVSGTSASAPTFAAMVSLVNAARMERGLPSVGWITKLIWEMGQKPASFPNKFITPEYDVTVGDNKCTATSGSGNVSDTCQAALVSTCCTQGFYATAGWDPASGWGGVDFYKFKQYFLALAMPTRFPSSPPTVRPTNPTANPTTRPTTPTSNPTPAPSHPTSPPTIHPTQKPVTARPSFAPSSFPTMRPTDAPISAPTPLPGAPTFAPTVAPLLCAPFSQPGNTGDISGFATCGIRACAGVSFNISTCSYFLGAKAYGITDLQLLSNTSLGLAAGGTLNDPSGSGTLCTFLIYTTHLPCQMYQLKQGCEPFTGPCHGTSAVIINKKDEGKVTVYDITHPPSPAPTARPSTIPSPAPTYPITPAPTYMLHAPTPAPTPAPTARPSVLPSPQPSTLPTYPPKAPTPSPTPPPTKQPSPAPSAVPTVPSPRPTPVPSLSAKPSPAPTTAPSPVPTTAKPPTTAPPSLVPTPAPSPAATAPHAASARQSRPRLLSAGAGSEGATEKALLHGRSDLSPRLRPDPATPHTVIFALSELNSDKLRALHADVSDPNSDGYMAQLSREEIVALTVDPAHEAAVRALLAQLTSPYGSVTEVKSSYFRSHVHATAPLALWEALLTARFMVYDRTDADGRPLSPITRAAEYIIPASLAAHVTSVLNTVQLPMPVTPRYAFQIGSFAGEAEAAGILSANGATTTAAPAAANTVMDDPTSTFNNTANAGVVYPAFLSGVYSIPAGGNVGVKCTLPNPNPLFGPPNYACAPSTHPFGQALFASLGQNYSPLDLNMFQKEVGGNPPGTTAANLGQQIVTNYGGHNGTMTLDGFPLPWPQFDECKTNPSTCMEANLDVQYMTGISQFTPTYFIYTNATNSMFSDFLTFVDTFAVSAVPWVISISYGGPEAANSPADMVQFELMALKLGLGGTTIVVASGDDGAPGTNARSNQEGSYACQYTADYPGSSPSVLTVGATRGPESGYPEVVCQSNGGGGVSSSGGFSLAFAPMTFQTKYIDGYFNSLPASQMPYPGFNRAGRGYPDVAVLGHNYVIINGQKFSGADGTSASAPVFAAMISLINAYRMAESPPLTPVGFISHFLYQYQQHFQHDVTQGDNKCTENAQTLMSGFVEGFPGYPFPSPTQATYLTASGCCAQGFNAAPGWDPVSGIGSVDYGALFDMLKSNEYVRRDRERRRLGLDATADKAAADKAAAAATAAPPVATPRIVTPPPAGPRRTSLSRRPDIKHMRRAPAAMPHEISVWLTQRNLEALHDTLLDLSDPRSPRYGQQWWTREQVAEYTAMPAAADGRSPAEQAVSILAGLGATSTRVSRYGDYVYATAPVGVWEKVLQAEFHVYQQLHLDGSVYALVVRCLEYTMPPALAGLAQHIFRTVQFPMPGFTKPAGPSSLSSGRWSSAKKKPVLSGVNVTSMIMPGYVTPALLADYYHIKSSSESAGFHGTIAVYEALNQTMSTEDLANFQLLFNLSSQGIPTSHDSGGHVNRTCNNLAGECAEANLDVQYITAILHDIDMFYIYIHSALDFMDGLLDILDMSSVVLNVVSISYGGQEYTVDVSDLDRFSVGALKHSMSGTTFVVSSGDDGAPGSDARPFGQVASKPAGGGVSACTYTSQFPASSPYVVSVGASMGPETPGHPEVACQGDAGGLVSTGGGFSQYYSMPSYQHAALASYQNQLADPANAHLVPVDGYHLFRDMATSAGAAAAPAVGRGYPDIAMLGYNYLCVDAGAVMAVSGTSASAPVFAAMVALANSRRLAAGKKPLGFLTPALYDPSAQRFLRDIDYGHNKCTSTQTFSFPPESQLAYSTCCSQGFHATAGWDPVAGLGGVADFEAFSAYFLQYTFPPTMYPTPSPVLTPSPSSNPNTLFLRSLEKLGGGAIFGIIFVILLLIGALAAAVYMQQIGTLKHLSCASFTSWDAFKALFERPTAAAAADMSVDRYGRDVIPMPGYQGGSISNPVLEGEIQMRESGGRESSFLSSSFGAPSSFSNKRL